MPLLLYLLPSKEVKIIASGVSLTLNHDYRFDLMMWFENATTVDFQMYDSNDIAVGAAESKYFVASTWLKLSAFFTSSVTDSNCYVAIKIPKTTNIVRFDDGHIIDLTQERKEYRVMRIQGSISPGGFVQTVTLREKTDAETA